jgi:hypothetical protein
MNATPPQNLSLIQGLPGEELILKGLADLADNRDTIESCLVRIASNRLSHAGILSAPVLMAENAELDLYQFYLPLGNDAHAKYNAMIRRLISFEQALDHRISRAA